MNNDNDITISIDNSLKEILIQDNSTGVQGGLLFSEPLENRPHTERIIIHHSEVATPHTVDDVHKWHLKHGWAGIGYHYFIDKNGIVFNGRPVETIGAHARGFNQNSIGVCFEGNFKKESMKSRQMSDEAIHLLALLQYVYGATIVFCDELPDRTQDPIPGFRRNEIRTETSALVNGFHRDEMDAHNHDMEFGGDHVSLFEEGIALQCEKYGIPYIVNTDYQLTENSSTKNQ